MSAGPGGGSTGKCKTYHESMEPILIAVMTSLVIGGAMIAIFLLTIHPIWSIVDVATSGRASNGEKAVWIIFCFLTWTLASVIYGLAFATRPLAVTTRILVIGFVIMVCIGGGLMITVPLARESIPGFSVGR